VILSETPLRSALQPFSYVLPSQPQTGLFSVGQTVGRGTHPPNVQGLKFRHAPLPKHWARKLQNLPGLHSLLLRQLLVQADGVPLHGPGFSTLIRPRLLAKHVLMYVRSSQPHTSAVFVGQDTFIF